MDGSPWLSAQPILNKLKQNGHEIVVVAPEANMHMKPSNDVYTMTTYPVPFTKEEFDQHFRGNANEMLDELPFIVRFVTTYNGMKKVNAMMFSTCMSLLYNQELMEHLEQSKFDAVLTDPLLPCGPIVAEHLGVPSVFFLRGILCGLDSEALLCPSPLSYVPRAFTTNMDHMTFVQRVKNLLFLLSESFLCGFLYSPYSNLAAEFLQKDMTLTELLSHGSVWLMRMDFVFEYPRPIMPNMIFVGGINCAGNKSLTQLLVVPMDGSHWLSMQSVLNQLKQNGHEIVVVAPEISMHIKPSDDVYTMKTYPVPFTEEELEEEFRSSVIGMFEELPFVVRFVKTYNKLKSTSAMFFSTCTSLLYNQELMEYLEQSKFDAVFTDPLIPCGQIVAEYLDVPSVFFLRTMPCGLDSEALHCPSPPSYVPRPLTANTDRMTFAQRVKNMLVLLSESFLCGVVYSPYSKLAAEFLQKDITLTELLGHGSVWLMKIDFVSDYPKPIMPNMIAIGGSNCDGRKSLTQVDAGKVLVIPFDGSHWLSMHQVVERLHQRGHEIVVIAPDVSLRIKPSVHYTLKTYPALYGEEFLKEEIRKFGHKAFSQQASPTETIGTVRNISTLFLDACKQLLYNKEIIAYLEENQFDVVFMVPASPCGQIVAEHLSLPSVYYSGWTPCSLEATRCPSPPSYVPKYLTAYADHMGFNQRVKNFLISSLEFLTCSLIYSPFNNLITEFLQREVTVYELYSQASVWLLRYDFAFEYPRPLMPNMVLIGGLHCEKKTPLTQVGFALKVTHMDC
uniref:Uncharacterized protein n=1 Tax=Sphaerodactylus townsendi TaxID=933632 RepID=A0ACB8GFL3_9SAUR